MKLNTVNVVEYVDDSIIGIDSFTDDEVGNKEAEDMFIRCAKENGANDKDLKDYDCIKEGMYECGTYQVFIIHSCN